MDVQALLIALLIGAIAGWLAGQLVQGTGFGLLGDILIGIVGALLDLAADRASDQTGCGVAFHETGASSFGRRPSCLASGAYERD